MPFPRSEVLCTVLPKIIAVLRDFWPHKTAAHISHVAGVSERSVKYWLAGVTRMSLEHIVALLRTEAGFDILKAVMGDCKEEWWLDTMTAAELRASRKMQRAEQKRTERLKELRAQREMYEDR